LNSFPNQGKREEDCSVSVPHLHEFYKREYPDSKITRFFNRVGEPVLKYHRKYVVEVCDFIQYLGHEF
jgi:hypothetical protein